MLLNKGEPTVVTSGSTSTADTGAAVGSRFGEVALRSRLVSSEYLNWALEEQRRLRSTGSRVPRLGELMVSQHGLTQDEVHDVLRDQADSGKPMFGRVAIDGQFCSQQELQEALEKQKEFQAMQIRTPRLGEILVARGALKRHQVAAVLKAQGKRVVSCPGCSTSYNAVSVRPGSKLQCPRCKTKFVPLPKSKPAFGTSSLLSSGDSSGEITQQIPIVNIVRQKGASESGFTAPSMKGRRRGLTSVQKNRGRTSMYSRPRSKFNTSRHEAVTRSLPPVTVSDSELDRRYAATEKLDPVHMETQPLPAMARGVRTEGRLSPVARRRLTQHLRRSEVDLPPVRRVGGVQADRSAAGTTSYPPPSSTNHQWLALTVFGAGIFLLAVIAIFSRDSDVKAERRALARSMQPDLSTPKRKQTAKATSKAVTPKRDTGKQVQTVPEVVVTSRPIAVPAAAPAPLDDESARQSALGAHLLSEARSLVHKGEWARAQEVYRAILTQFGTFHGPTARKELSDLESGEVGRIPSPAPVAKPAVVAMESRPKPAAAPTPVPVTAKKAEPLTSEAGQATESAKSEPFDAEQVRTPASPSAPSASKPQPHKVSLAIKDVGEVLGSLGLSIAKGSWTVDNDGTLSGEPNPGSRICTLRGKLPRFETLSVQIRGNGSGAGFSFGKGKRFMVKPSAEWQTVALRLGEDDILHMTVDGRSPDSQEAIDPVHREQLPENFYLRGQEGRISFRNLTFDGRTKQNGGTSDAVRPVASSAHIKEWEVVTGAWSSNGKTLTSSSEREVGSVKRSLRGFRKLSVRIRGDGDAAGISFGKGLRFLIRPIADWQTLTLEQFEDGAIGMWINGESRSSLEEVVKGSKLGEIVYLRALGRRVEFRDFMVVE